jgi:glycosyltransferase involved in cell wall biosynthesis
MHSYSNRMTTRNVDNSVYIIQSSSTGEKTIKILVMCAALDLSKPIGSTPALWQLFKAMYEGGHELLIIPYSGHSIDSIWWRSFPNPNYYKGLIMERILKMVKHSPGKRNMPFIPMLARVFARPNLERSVMKIIQKESDIDAILIINLPLNQLDGFVSNIRNNYRRIPVILYDVDVPTSLPSHGGFTFNHYVGADLSEYDSFIIPSEGSVDELKALGAREVNVVHFGVDTDVYTPLQLEQDIDLLFFGNGSRDRANNIRMMITEPSRVLLKYKFTVSGRYLEIDAGNALVTPAFSFMEWRRYCSRSKINLNVVRESHANVYGTSTSRPFELASMQCCIVSAPYKGLEKWFEVGKEILVANSSKECIDLYQTLINDEDLRVRMGKAARARVIKEHTSKHRAIQITDIIQKTSV